MAHIIVYSTFPHLKSARDLSKKVLDQKLAACIQLIPAIESHYIWKGKREKSKEVLALIKTRKLLFPKLRKLIEAHHPYDVPEIISVPILAGNSAYLRWIGSQTLVR